MFLYKNMFITKKNSNLIKRINKYMLVIADGFRRPILLFLLWCHFLIFDKLTGIDPVQIWIALVPKGTGSLPQSMGKRNWSRSKRNWEIPISDQNRSAFSHLHYLCFHRLMFHLLKSQAIRDNQHIKMPKTLIPFVQSPLKIERISVVWGLDKGFFFVILFQTY